MSKEEQLHSLALTRPLKALKHENDDDNMVMTGHKDIV
jgi:hypothetical protein